MAAAAPWVTRDGERKARSAVKRGLKWGAARPRELPPELESSPVVGAIRPVSHEAVVQARRDAELAEAEAEAKRDGARQLMREADYLSAIAARLWRHADALDDLRRRRISDECAKRFGIGYDVWPVDGAWAPGETPSVVIPYTVRGEIRTTQYRHLTPVKTKGGESKYHWHPTLGAAKLWNADAVLDPTDSYVVIVEGALNALTLCSAGFNAVALPTIGGWRPEFAPWFARFDDVYWAPDAGAIAQWRRYAADVPGSRIARLPVDPDEYLVAADGDVDVLWRALRYAEPV